MWIWIANIFAKFHAKRHNWSEDIPESFRGLLYFENTLCSVQVLVTDQPVVDDVVLLSTGFETPCVQVHPVYKYTLCTSTPCVQVHPVYKYTLCSVQVLVTDQPVVDDVVLLSTGRVWVEYHIAVSAKHLTNISTFQFNHSIRSVFTPLHSPDLSSTSCTSVSLSTFPHLLQHCYITWSHTQSR